MHNSLLVRIFFLQCILYLTISITATSQQIFPFKHQEWRTSTQQGVKYQLKTNEKNTALLEYGSIDQPNKTDSLVSINNIFRSDSIIARGAILVEGTFRTNKLTDANEVGIFIEASLNGQPPFVYRNTSTVRIKNHDTINDIHLFIPFETPINSIHCFVYIKGVGRIQVNQLKITVTKGEFDESWKSAYAGRASKEQALKDKLALFIKVWGFLKYYNPVISEKHIDWDAVFVKNIPAIFHSDKAADFQQQINNLIVASQVNSNRNTPGIDSFSKEQLINFDDHWLQEPGLLDNKTRTKLLDIKKRFREFPNYYVQVIESNSIIKPEFPHEEAYKLFSLPDMPYRLLMLTRYWNIIQYYYPYKYAIGEDWDQVLEKHIPVFTAATTRNAYISSAWQLNAEINDGHASLNLGDDKISFWKAAYQTAKIIVAPLQLRIIDPNQVVVSKIDTTFSNITGIRNGDNILSINNKDISSHVSTLANYVSAGRQDMKYYYISTMQLLSGIPSTNDSLLFKWMSGDRKIHYTAIKADQHYFKTYSSFLAQHILGVIPIADEKPAVKMLNDSILYIDISRYSYADSTKLLALLPLVRNAIIDFRKYPATDAYSVIPFFVRGGIPYVNFMPPRSHPAILDKKIEGQTLADRTPFFNGHLALLIAEGTQSQGEFLTMMLQTQRNVRLIGRTTAGADGNISRIPGVGIPNFLFSGVRITYPDNRETQRVGIKPDITVPLSVAEATGDKDVILQEAIHYLEQ